MRVHQPREDDGGSPPAVKALLAKHPSIWLSPLRSFDGCSRKVILTVGLLRSAVSPPVAGPSGSHRISPVGFSSIRGEVGTRPGRSGATHRIALEPP